MTITTLSSTTMTSMIVTEIRLMTILILLYFADNRALPYQDFKTVAVKLRLAKTLGAGAASVNPFMPLIVMIPNVETRPTLCYVRTEGQRPKLLIPQTFHSALIL